MLAALSLLPGDRLRFLPVADEGASILVVEDDASLRLVCRVTLELERFRVREAAALTRAREEIAADRPALVFLDLNVGGEASDGLLEELRAAEIPVVIVSGTDMHEAYRDRASEVIVKPFDPAQLVAAARRHAVG
jgi:DNA-binding NtrC family response regulator